MHTYWYVLDLLYNRLRCGDSAHTDDEALLHAVQLRASPRQQLVVAGEPLQRGPGVGAALLPGRERKPGVFTADGPGAVHGVVAVAGERHAALRRRVGGAGGPRLVRVDGGARARAPVEEVAQVRRFGQDAHVVLVDGAVAREEGPRVEAVLPVVLPVVYHVARDRKVVPAVVLGEGGRGG